MVAYTKNTHHEDIEIIHEVENVDSVKKFIDIAFEYSKDEDFEFFYRGHSKKDEYKLEPSLYRKDKQGNYLYLENEDKLFKELITFIPSEFHNDKFTIDKLMRMQHYSLPTRLLDISSNPLIALYFACKSNLEDIGEIIIFKIPNQNIKFYDSDTVSCIANLVRLNQREKDEITKLISSSSNFNSESQVKRLLHFIKEEKSFFEPNIAKEDLKKIICVKGKKNNDRISSQSGAFLLFGLDTIFNEAGIDSIEIKRISIDNKEQILRELDILNINESTVFPYIENSSKYVANKFKFKS